MFLLLYVNILRNTTKHKTNPLFSCMTELVEPHWTNRWSFHQFILSYSPFSPPLHVWPLHLFLQQHSLSITSSLLSSSSCSVSLNFSLPFHQALADFSHTHIKSLKPILGFNSPFSSSNSILSGSPFSFRLDPAQCYRCFTAGQVCGLLFPTNLSLGISSSLPVSC